MDERSEELEGPQLALLELYRDASGPSPEVEDRLLARIQAQADVEADLADDDGTLLGGSSREAIAAEPSVRPLTAALIAIVAFAAGVALTWGLRSDLLAVDDHRDTPSVSPMTAEGARVHEVPLPIPAQACGPVVVEKRVEVPVPVRTDDADGEAMDDDRDPSGSIAVPPSSGWDEGDDEPTHDDEGDPILRQRTIAMAPWSAPRSNARGSGAEPPPRSAKRRPSRGAGIYGPTSGSSTRPGKPTAGAPGTTPGSSGGDRGPGSSGGNDGGRGRPGGSDPGGNDGDGTRPPAQPDPTDPNDPPPPSKPEDEPPPPEEPPRDDEPNDDAMPDWQECEEQYTTCYDGLMPWCEQDPEACAEAAYTCDLEYQYCIDPWADAWQECDQAVIECYMEADAICLQEGQMEYPEQCMALYEQCELEYMDCLGAFGESEDEAPVGHIYD